MHFRGQDVVSQLQCVKWPTSPKTLDGAAPTSWLYVYSALLCALSVLICLFYHWGMQNKNLRNCHRLLFASGLIPDVKVSLRRRSSPTLGCDLKKTENCRDPGVCCTNVCVFEWVNVPCSLKKHLERSTRLEKQFINAVSLPRDIS